MSLAGLTGPSSAWLPLFVVWCLSVLGSAAVLVYRTLHLPPSDGDIARYVGGHVPDLRSDLLSVVELAQSPVGCSPGLIAEFPASAPRPPRRRWMRRLVDFRPRLSCADRRRRAAAVLLRLGAMLGGARLLLQSPAAESHRGRQRSAAGDLRLLLTYPRWLHRAVPPRVVPSSSGDVNGAARDRGAGSKRVLIPVERAHAVLQLEGGSKHPGADRATAAAPMVRIIRCSSRRLRRSRAARTSLSSSAAIRDPRPRARCAPAGYRARPAATRRAIRPADELRGHLGASH